MADEQNEKSVQKTEKTRARCNKFLKPYVLLIQTIITAVLKKEIFYNPLLRV